MANPLLTHRLITSLSLRLSIHKATFKDQGHIQRHQNGQELLKNLFFWRTPGLRLHSRSLVPTVRAEKHEIKKQSFTCRLLANTDLFFFARYHLKHIELMSICIREKHETQKKKKKKLIIYNHICHNHQ